MLLIIAFSILVHEKLEVVIDQIHNFKKFNPGSIIILHISEDFKNELKGSIDFFLKYNFVYINPRSLKTGLADNSQFLGHLSNINHLLTSNVKYDYVCFHASNDMFVRSGLCDFIIRFDVGSTQFKINSDSEWEQGRNALKDKNLIRCVERMTAVSELNLFGSNIEGSYLNYDISKKIHELCLRNNLNKNNFIKFPR